jgi:hypothetical protein
LPVFFLPFFIAAKADALFQFALEARTRREAADSATARQGEATQLSFSMRIGINPAIDSL